MADPNVTRRLVFEFDDEYTEDDLHRDIGKTHMLPLAQVGTPSPYRAPPKPRVVRVVKSSAPPDAPTATFPLVSVKPMPIKSTTTAPSVTALPEGLKTPVSNSNEWKPPRPTVGALPMPVFASNNSNDAPQLLPPQPQSQQKSTTKVVQSRYMQSLAKIEASSKSVQKSSTAAPREPLSSVDVNNATIHDPEKRRMTIASTKKTASKPPQTALSRESVGPKLTSSRNTMQERSQSSTNLATNASTQASTTTTSAAPISNAQSELRAALLQRREQKAAAKQAAAAAKPTARPSIGPSTSASQSTRLSLASSTSTFSQQASAAQTPQSTRKQAHMRQQSTNALDSASKRVSLDHTPGHSRVVASRYMNTKTTTNKVSVDEGNTAPTPTRTPSHLKRSFSTSSISKLPSAKKASSSTAQTQQDALKREQIATISARIATATAPTSATTTNSNTQQRKDPAVNFQALQLETQLMHTQLLQWHFINRRLEQARVAKRAAGTHMIMAVLNKIDAMKKACDEAEAQLNAKQARVYQEELDHFKVSCVQPILQNVDQFLVTYSDTATQLERDMHKMPMIGVDPVDSRALMSALKQSYELLEMIQRDFSEHFKDWQRTGTAARRLSTAVEEEVSGIKSYTEILHALSSLGNHEASLIIHKNQLQDEIEKLK